MRTAVCTCKHEAPGAISVQEASRCPKGHLSAGADGSCDMRVTVLDSHGDPCYLQSENVNDLTVNKVHVFWQTRAGLPRHH